MKLLSKRRLYLILILLGFSFIFLAFSLFIKSTRESTPSSSQSTLGVSTTNTPLDSIKDPIQVSIGHPSRLAIPIIKVDAIVTHLGLTASGDMDIPKDPKSLAWYKFGPNPGEKGSSVIAGHSNWISGGSAVFDNLKKLVPGDIIHVEDSNGKLLSFMVRESRNYDPEADATSVFMSSDNGSHLNLITCSGEWLISKQTTTKRLVVFSDFIAEAKPD